MLSISTDQMQCVNKEKKKLFGTCKQDIKQSVLPREDAKKSTWNMSASAA